MENRNYFPIIYTRKSFVPYRNCPKEYTICSISVFRETQPPLRTSADLGVPRFGLCPTARSRQTQCRNAQDVTALSLFSLLCVLRDHGPVHVDAVAEDVPLRRVAAGVVPQHTGRILADQQVVLRVAVVIPCPDHEPVVGVELAARLFDSEAEVNAQISVVETEYNERKAARETSSAEAEGQRQAELDEIGSRWDMANKSATEAEAKEINDHQAAYEEALSGAASEIAEAREAWKAALEEVRQKAVEKTEKIEAVKEKTESAVEETQRSETRIAEISTADKAMGAWSSEALDAMLGGNAQERTAKATEQMAKNTQQTNKLLKKIGKEKVLTYG